MTAKELLKSKSTPRDIGSLLSGNDPNNDLNNSLNHGSHQEQDIFSFLSAMNGGQLNSAAVHVLASRKRKFFDQGGGTQFGGGNSSGKFFGGLRSALHRRNSDDDPPLHTPQCSQSGYADEEDRRNNQRESEEGDPDDSNQVDEQGKSRLGILSPGQSTIIADIDENLAADFDGSLSGLGVDMNSTTYSMSEALMALPNLTNSNASHVFKQEVPSPPTHPANPHHYSHHATGMSRMTSSLLKEEPSSKSKSSVLRSLKGNHRSSPQNYGALDLSSDEAVSHFPESDTSEEAVILGPKTFTGSVSRVGTPTNVTFHPLTNSNSHQHLSHLAHSLPGSFSAVNLSASHPNLTMIGSTCKDENISNASGENISDGNVGKCHKVILPLQSSAATFIPRKDSQEMSQSSSSSNLAPEPGNGPFQFTLNASTSIATKINEPSITYLNQGQAYELTLKKIGDIPSNRKRVLKCQLRVGFHERRLQYMEMEHIHEWSSKHPTERILDIDLPLSYGIMEPVRDPCRLNVVTFKWDPTRDTGIFIKVNCISTEFTPKKHGGEKGVPFRLQIEAFDLEDKRLYAAGCILQVFKLKGADRKHKQDRDKIQKRPLSEQEKYVRPYGCTILTELPPDCVYNPQNSRSASPVYFSDLTLTNGVVTENPISNNLPQIPQPRDDGQGMFYVGSLPSDCKESFMQNGSSVMESTNVPTNGTCSNTNILMASATVDMVTQWLSRNRYGSLIPNFRNYSGRDLLRLSREDIISLCGLCDGLRLYNDLHMVSVAPRTTVYIAMRESLEYDALFLEDLTVNELLKRLSECTGIQESVFGNVYKKTRGFVVRVTDTVVQFIEPESFFYFTLRHAEDGKCDVILEDVFQSNRDSMKNLSINENSLN